ncbi:MULTISPECIES: hypothetical protein [Testudinibacter]|uniref:Uncharacterized protein n=1 Tax=Testudinibacter aquarius TaxID=1524974 RepID=A0A4V2W2A0_9PAST|nr:MULTISPECIES: hypothetical protein [Testudinibacter]TNG95180.1 hypothetical protein FHQ19_05230 [Pasteurellaceae bacterium UScroc12]TNG96219.1 hypothetical protein FHQ20_05265 [Pasteurellaceae bacterium USgator41]TNH01616.1 hypothetical protein FHQ24_00665 [Pasteurellaceae bacterium UScroc31]TNH02946.1 hypothetical protein FHQ28_01430 [Pasteurellaceae bacterium USgator11]TNH06539.1 hypothetical protein FHQ30_07595 [Pasteurellaceae bacterium Phil11]
MALAPLVVRKFECASEQDAEQICVALNKAKYRSVALGSAVVSQCRPTKKLEGILAKVNPVEVIPSDYDLEQIRDTIA